MYGTVSPTARIQGAEIGGAFYQHILLLISATSCFCCFSGFISQGTNISTRVHSNGLTKLGFETDNWTLWAFSATRAIVTKDGESNWESYIAGFSYACIYFLICIGALCNYIVPNAFYMSEI